MDRTGKSIKNIYFALILQVITTMLSFMTRTVLVKIIGIDLLGLNGLFTEVISALSLAELGIGSSIAYSLYAPVAEDDTYKICQLMQLYKKAYHVIAGTTLFIGLGLTPWINYLVKAVDIDSVYIRIVYVLFVLQLSTSYLFSYKVALLNVDQKNYVYSKISAIVKVVGTGMQIGLVLLTHNYIVYLIATIVISLTTNAICSVYVNKNYTYLNKVVDKIGKNEKKIIFSNMKNIFIKSVSGKITGSTDNILISTLIGTALVGYYSNYNLVLNLIRTFVAQIYAGVFNSVGNMMVTEDNTRCEQVFFRLNYIIYLIATTASVCVLTCMEPFITAWLGQQYLLERNVLIICSVMIYIEIICKPLWLIMEVSGLFSLDKYASIAGSTVNLLVSVVLGLKLGIIGIFIGTCLTYIIQMFCKAFFLYHYKWGKSPLVYYKMWGLEILGGLVLMVVCRSICNQIVIDNALLQCLINAVITISIVICVTICVTFRTDEFKYVTCLIKSKIRKTKSERGVRNE